MAQVGMAHGQQERSTTDQTTLPVFRALLAGQFLVTVVPGVLAVVAPATLASILGYAAADPFLYGLYGSAVLGYALVAVLGFRDPGWKQARIPVVATLTFAVAAVVAAVIQLANGERTILSLGVPLAGAVAIPSCIYFLRRDEGDRTGHGPRIQPWFRVLLVLATAAAAVFGLLPLLAPRVVPDITGFTEPVTMMFRIAGAATLGYAAAGVLELRSRDWGELRFQNPAAVLFNGLSAVVAAVAVAGGNRAPMVLLILVAATVFAVGLAYGQWDAYRRSGTA